MNLEDNAIWLVYLWGLYDDLGFLVSLVLLCLGFSTVFILVLGTSQRDVYHIDSKEYKYWKKFQRLSLPLFIIFITLLTIKTFVPSKNIAIAMISAKPLIGIAKEAKDSDTAKSIGNILDNSIKYLEKRSEELTKDK